MLTKDHSSGAALGMSPHAIWVNPAELRGKNRQHLADAAPGHCILCGGTLRSTGMADGPSGGETGIRTLGTLAGSTVFETAPFDHSGTSPRLGSGSVGGHVPMITRGRKGSCFGPMKWGWSHLRKPRLGEWKFDPFGHMLVAAVAVFEGYARCSARCSASCPTYPSPYRFWRFSRPRCPLLRKLHRRPRRERPKRKPRRAKT